MPYHIDEENSELAFEVREGNKLVIKIKSNIFSDSLELYLIKVGDNTEPTDKNVFSSLRVLKEIENLHDTILKEINSVTSGFWELKQDSQGNEYISTKYNVLTEGGLTTYGLGEQKLGTIYDGLPIDNDTIYWEEVEGSRVLKAKGSGGGSTGLDETKLWNVLGTPGDQQIDYSHLRSAFSQFSNNFVTINTEQEITALKHFTAGLSVGSAKKKIYEKDGVLYIDSNVAITGALTMYATDGQSVSSIYDGLPIDNDTIYWETVEESRVLKAKGGSSFDENAMWSALSGSSDNQINKSHLTTALTGYATESWVSGKNYAVKATTLAGYGITDAYTKTESDNKYPTKTGSGASGTWGINITGNAGTATKLQTARTLWGNNFDGTANISGDITLAIGKGIYLSANDERWLLQTKRSDNTQINGIKTNGFQMCTYFGDTKTMQFSNDRIYSYVDFRAQKDLYINGIRLHKTADGVITLEGNLAVTGGVTMYAIDPVSVSTVMDGVVVDGTTIKKENGKLVAVGGGEAGSVAWGNISGKPSVFATNIANITDLHSSWDAVLKAQKPAWLTAVSIATISDLHANWDALLKAAPSAYVTRWPTISEVTGKQNLVVKLNGGTTEGTNQFTYNATAAKTINITASSVGAAASSHNHSWSNITSGKPTTLAGYGITDAPTKTGSGASGTWSIDISGKASNADKLDGTHKRTGDTYWGVIPYVETDGTFEIGKYLDFHVTSSDTKDYSTRVQAQGAYNNIVNLPTANGNIALTSDNVASASKLQTTHTLWGQNFNGTQNVSGNMSNVGKISANGEIITSSANSFRAVYGGYGFFIRNDGVSTYFMHTNKDDPYGGWNNNRPITIDNASGRISINSALDVGSVTTFYNKVTGTSISCSDWHRSTGQTGWVNDSYGGGIYMTDATWVRVWNGKGFLCENTIESSYKLSARQLVNVYGALGYGWGSGQAAFQVAIPTNENQTPILLAYNGVNGNQTGNDRYFAIEVLNTGLRNVHFNVSGKETVRMRANYFEVNGDILATGGTTFYGSDIRYKSIIHPVMLLALNKIAEAPSFVYRWNKKGMKRDRLNLGGSAQYTQLILPWAVEENDNFLSMDYATVAYTFAVHTARHLLTYETRTDKKIKKLENRVKYLEKQLKKLGYEEVHTLDDQSV
jgi:hypothetical protein